MRIKYKLRLKRNGKSVVQGKSKSVDINGTVIGNPKRGTFTSRFGTRIHGMKIVYEKKIAGGAGRDGRIKRMKVEKIISLPRKAFNIKIAK